MSALGVLRTAGRQALGLWQDLAEVRRIAARGPGYSGLSHYRFFRHILADVKPPVERVLVLGVYYGRDIMMISSLARCRPGMAGPAFSLTGVDKFADSACDDWPPESRGLTWREAGFGPAPSMERASRLVDEHRGGLPVKLVQREAEAFLQTEAKGPYDWIYIDTAHDYASTKELIRLSLRQLRPGGILSGDDYSDVGTWGVRSAVEEALPKHLLWDGWIWYAQT